ncbi:uncharacterized protein EV420DRAFT_672155 [Desarmillaria tabescens]|uniref:Prolyl 4-hydroxylase alpha subunit Fe(2+) 2OG dioxygenase domain-containing protein n=1 Tax=Armillaria tabescens TaxID=1929756 RepID=A0AA39NKD7_ARMTA|nr:uncharacterized protein EV420DRAFT_672155 [Desarmillaria tabescens]KAK0467210.1 hypothetical protein EV420DRAFT_672155 [Desarmillaria tabescens]
MNDISDTTSLPIPDTVAPTIDSAAGPTQASRDASPGVDTNSEDQRDVEAMLIDSKDTEVDVSADIRPTVGGKTCYAVPVENDNPDSQDAATPRSRATSPPSDSHPSVGGKTYYVVPLRRQESESTILSEEGLTEPQERASVGGKTWIPSVPPASPEREDAQADGADSGLPLNGETRMPSMPPPTSETPPRPSLGGKTWTPSIPTVLSGEEVLSPEASTLPEKTTSGGSENIDIDMENTTEQEDEHDDDDESVLSDGGDLREEFEAAMGGDFAFKGSYAYSGPFPQAPNPCLAIEGIGPIGLPLSPRDAQLIIDCASQAPYGHNEQTIVNTEVRDTWEIDQGSIKFENPLWDIFVKQTVVPTVSQSLGTPSANVRCDLYKLLLYQEGSHFHKHQDTAKVPGMFGTIIIILPSSYKGGEVHVSHSGSSQVFDFSEQSLVSTAVLAWYTDVFHEVKPVKSGYRLALSYNLVQTVPTAPLPSLPNMHTAVHRLRRVLQKWRKDRFQSDPLDLVAYILSHEYSAAELRIGAMALKGQDAHKAAHLQSVAKDLDYVVCLGSLSYRQSGQAEDMGFHSSYGWKRRRYDPYDESEDESSYRMGEDYETFLTVDNIVDMKGNHLLASGKASLELSDDSLVPQDPFDGEDPDDEEYEGYMGNYGGTLDHFYRRTVLMLVHEDDSPRVFFSAAGGINYGLQRLKNAGSEVPTADDLKIANLVIDRLNIQNKQSALSMSEFAIKWKNLEIWKRIVKATAFDLTAYGLDRIVTAWRTFTFEGVRPVLEKMVAKTSKLKIAHDFLKGISEAATDDELIVREWSRLQLSQALLTLTTPDSEDVPILISVIKEKGTAWFSETIMPRLAKSPSLYSFWIAFVNSLHTNRDTIQETIADSSTPKPALLVQCLDNVLNLWESVVAVPNLRPYYYTGPPPVAPQQPMVTRIIQLVDLCISTDHTEMCKTLFVTILKRKPPSHANFQALYTPLIPELRQLLQKKKIDICAPPFADIMQIFIGSYLHDVLGAKPRAVNIRRLGCGCAECGMLNTFLKNTSAETTLRFLQAKRNHIEGFLRGATDLVTYETVRSGRPQGLLVRKRPDVLASLQWSARQADVRTFLNMIGDDDVISKLVGRRYADVLRALEGMKQFTLPMHPAPGPPPIEVDAPSQDAATSVSVHSVVAGTKRKQPRKPMVITGPVIDLTED